jgi:hypothetical protein
VRGHKALRRIETRLAVANVLRAKLDARRFARTTGTRRRPDTSAASATCGTTRAARASHRSARATHATRSGSAWTRATHWRWRWKIVCLLNADDLRTRESRLLFVRQLLTRWAND